MATIEEQEKLLQTLKFTPRTYRISMWGYGGEIAMGSVDRKIYDYFKHRRLDVSDFAWNSDYAEEQNIPEEMWPFPPGSWYECDNMAHVNGVDRESGTLQIEDENGVVIYERSLDDLDGCSDDSPQWGSGDEAWICQEIPGQAVFVGRSNEKGTFFEGEINLTAPFDITKLTLGYDEVDGSEIINSVYYNDEDIDNYGGSTDGKSSDFGFYLVKDDQQSWEAYLNGDSIKYDLTNWFPKKVNPVRTGLYEIETAGKNSYTYQARWTGDRWVSSWAEESEYNDPSKEVKIKQWRGIAYDPDAEEWDPAEELDKICADVKEEEMTQALKDFKADPRGWPF